MSEPPLPGTPPEVPEEFAEAYRAAYARALEAQSTPLAQGDHADRSPRPASRWRRARDESAHDEAPVLDGVVDGGVDDLPERTRPIVVGTHRTVDAVEDYDDRPSAYERIRDSWWFVPLLLVLIAVALIVAAYVGGRSFAHHVGRSQVSSTIVNGPSLTIATLIWAPKTPVSTGVPAATRAARTAS